jgi:hypothetical protein
MVEPVIPLTRSAPRRAALIGAGLLIFVVAAIQQRWHRQP